MSIRDRLPKKPSASTEAERVPLWVAEGSSTTKELYQAVKTEYDRLTVLIKSGSGTNAKDRTLVRARIAKLAGRDRSLISVRRQPEICDYIDRLNKELEILSSLNKAAPSKSKQRTKRELEKEVGQLRQQVKAHSDTELRAIVEGFFASHFLDDRTQQAMALSHLRQANEELADKVTRLQRQNKLLSSELAAMHDLLTSTQRAKLGGIRPVKEIDGDNDK